MKKMNEIEKLSALNFVESNSILSPIDCRIE
jgi:hypothetical protein